jgi:hypothetical protein
MTLGEDRRNTRGCWAHEKEKLHLTATLDGAVYKKKFEKTLPEYLDLALGEDDLFPECLVPGTREGPLPRVPTFALGEVYFIFLFFPHFFRPSHII